MNDAQKNVLISWLNDAHAMELSLLQNLQEKKKDAEDTGNTSAAMRIGEHITETERHVEDTKSCVERLGGTTSVVKNVTGRVLGYADGVMTSMFADTSVKNALETYAAEALEIASYTSLIAAANAVGDGETAEVCSRILDDEIRMSDWALTEIPSTTEIHLIAQTD